MVSWDKISQPKKLGGLGIRSTREANTAMLGKLVWDMHCNSHKLWVQMLSHKYVKDGCFFYTTLHYGSPIWNAIFKAKEDLKEGFQFRVGNGESFFWYSPWTVMGPLCHQVFAVNIQDTNK